MNKLEYINYRIKCGAWLGTSVEEAASPAEAKFKPGFLWDTLSLGSDPVANAVAEGSKKNYENKKDRKRGWWSLASYAIPGVEGLSKLFNARDNAKKGKKLAEEKYKDKPKALEAFNKLYESVSPKLFKEKVIRYGVPTAASVAGGLYGLSKKRKKYRKEDEEFNKILQSEEFQALPNDQKLILMDAMRKRKTGKLRRGLGYLFNSSVYGFGAKSLADLPAWFMANRQISANNKYMRSPEYKAMLSAFNAANK